jgi:erythronate-4-phosphate dehydrogenase
LKIVADENIPFVAECFASLGEVNVVPGRAMDPAAVAGADALIVRSVTRVDASLLESSRVKFVGTATIGFEHLDTDYLEARKIGFASAPGSNAESVAEYVVAALLEVSARQRRVLEGRSLGIVGAGNVGSRLASRASSLGMEVVLNDPPLQRDKGSGIYRPLEELFGCDVISIHTPLTFSGPDRTFHLAGRAFFDSLPRGCTFINTSRGPVADTAALKDALEKGRLSAAVIDVWENEPEIDTGLLEMAALATPHIAGYSIEGKVSGLISVYLAACRFFGSQPLFDADSFLPREDRQAISLKGEVPDEEALGFAVRGVYDITADDARMRSMLGVPVSARGGFFDRLRKEYPRRRQFASARINAVDLSGELRKKLAGIGFMFEK